MSFTNMSFTNMKSLRSLDSFSYTRKYIPVIFIVVLITIVYILVQSSEVAIEGQQYKVPNGVYQVLSEIEKFSQKNDEMKTIIENYLNNLEDILQKAVQKKMVQKLTHELETVTHSFVDKNYHDSHKIIMIKPSTEYEELRRRVRQNIQQMCNYYSFELEKIRGNLGFANEINKKIPNIPNILQLSGELKKMLISDIDQMRLVDGYETWRHKEAGDLSNLVQRRLQYIQNPKDCKSAKKLLCDINQECGFSCQLHHAVQCLIAAYSTERTMVLKSKGWKYHRGGWEEIFQPVSKTCTEYNNNELENWPGTGETKVLFYPGMNNKNSKLSHLSLSVPEDLLPRIQKLHGDPSVWWISQFTKYLFKLKHEGMMKTIKKNLGWIKPIVGVQIHHTNKVNYESVIRVAEEYMTYVEDYYQTLETNNTKLHRHVFLATNDPQVITEVRTKYPQYTIFSNTDFAKNVGVSTRNTDLNGILSDILILSLSDYLVCNFNSNICRTAYEIMQNHYPDASDRCKSPDYVYFFAGQRPHDHKAQIQHNARNNDEINIKSGDIIHVYTNQWNGLSKGKNMRTLKVGLFPTFKVKDQIKTAKLPNYLNLNLIV